MSYKDKTDLTPEEARDRVWAVRRGEAFHATADAIQHRHGSRLSGLPPSGQRTRADPVANQHPGSSRAQALSEASAPSRRQKKPAASSPTHHLQRDLFE